jgi:hypothetical protein
MGRREKDRQSEFMQALGECFAECVCPPVPLENMFVADCWDVVCQAVGDEVTPARLAALTPADLRRLSAAFGEYFSSAAPSVRQLEAAVATTLARWPVGSLGERAE